MKYKGEAASVVSFAHIGTHGQSILVDVGGMLVPQLGLGMQVLFIETADHACRHGTN